LAAGHRARRHGRQVFDCAGAGDTRGSVFWLWRWRRALRWPMRRFLANTAAGVVVGKLGTASVSPEELAAALGEIQE